MSTGAHEPRMADRPARERAATDFATNLVVTAGAGTGKTSLLIERILSAVVGRAIPLDRVLAVTFTDKAAGEMRVRLAEALERLAAPARHGGEGARASKSEAGRAYRRLTREQGLDGETIRERARQAAVELDRARVGTLHAFCTDLLREHPRAGGVDPYFEIDEGAAFDRLRRHAWDAFLVAELGPAPPRADLWRTALAHFSLDHLRALAAALCDFKIPLDQVAGQIAGDDAGQSILRPALAAVLPFAQRFRRDYLQAGHVNFDGLLVLARDLLRDHPEVRERVRQSIDQLLVDEFQDTDPLQYEIVFFLAEEFEGAADDPYAARMAAGRLFIVGDPKQSIYRFRGADMAAYRRAVDALTDAGAKRLSLTSSFRAPDGLLSPLNVMFQGIIGGGGAASASYEPGYEAIHSALGGTGAPERGVEIWSIDSGGEKPPGAGERRLLEGRAIARWLHEEARKERLSFRNVALLFRKLTDVDPYLRALGEWNIPFVLQGGSAFHERPEVAELVSLLRATVNPNDQAALLGVLRTPLGGCSDEELARLRAAGHRLRIDALDGIDAAAFPDAARTLSMIRDLRRRLLDSPIDDGLRAILDETPLLELNACAYQGARRVANLRKLVDRVAETARRETLSLEATLDLLDREFAVERRSGDSPLADESVDAVRLLTIHAAKGLEFPVVFIPDLAREDRRLPTSDIVRWVACAGEETAPGVLAARLAGQENAAWTASEEEEERHREAEEKRVFYVACTRARERLILVNGHPKPRANALWIQHVGAWGYRVDAGFPPPGELAAGVRHVVLSPPARRAPGRTPVDVRRVREAHRNFARAAEAARARAGAGIRSPSGVREDQEAVLEAGEATAIQRLEGRRGSPAALARVTGIAVHDALARWDFRDVSALMVDLARAAAQAAGEAGIDAGEVGARARAILDPFLASELPGRFARAEILGRELPMLLEEDGTTWWGWIDLVLREEGAVVVIDWKTDADEDFARTGPARHGAQLAIYAGAVQRALGLAEPPRRELVHVPTGRAVPLVG